MKFVNFGLSFYIHHLSKSVWQPWSNIRSLSNLSLALNFYWTNLRVIIIAHGHFLIVIICHLIKFTVLKSTFGTLQLCDHQFVNLVYESISLNWQSLLFYFVLLHDLLDYCMVSLLSVWGFFAWRARRFFLVSCRRLRFFFFFIRGWARWRLLVGFFFREIFEFLF